MTKEKLNQLHTLLEEAHDEMHSLSRHAKDDSIKKFFIYKASVFTHALNSLPCLEEEQQ